MENVRLAPDNEADDLYSGFEVNEGLLNVSFNFCFALTWIAIVKQWVLSVSKHSESANSIAYISIRRACQREV